MKYTASFSLLSALFGSSFIGLSSGQCRTENKVLFYGPVHTTTTRCKDWYEDYTTGLGYTAVVADSTTWSGMSQSDFEKFNAIVFCDPVCRTDESLLSTAESNANTWGSAIDGNMLIIGTDEAFHYTQGGQQLIENGLDYVLDDTCDNTGLYISLSCYYFSQSDITVDVLSHFGTFIARDPTGCFDDAHIVATHPVLTGITDSTLSNWGCSVHEIFTTYPTTTFTPLAIALNEGTTDGSGMSFPDGSFGVPYILANNVDIIGGCDIPECDHKPCSFEEDVYCRIHHSNGCDECKYGFWKLDYNHPCISCHEYFGDGCLFCQDFNGCGQCRDGCTRVYDEDCKIWECDCPGDTPIPPGEIDCLGIELCHTNPCTCSEPDLNCNICHVNGCDECKPGYFKKSYGHKCEQCQEIFGNNCLFCQDFNGCGQCKEGCTRVFNHDCQLWECHC